MGKEKIVVSAGDLHNSRIEAIFYITLVITCIQAGYILWDLVSLVPGSDVLLGLEGPNTRTASPYMSALYLIFLGLYAGYKEFRR
jgi:hypothetical protein